MTDRAHRIAVVGAGPAGFYATGHLLDAEPEIEVDLYDRLPTPWGLARAVLAVALRELGPNPHDAADAPAREETP